MTFRRELAQEITFDDPGVAQFFAGRHDEIDAFKEALKRASQKTQAVFSIYQGPPGCGKTSLAVQLEKIMRKERVLFVRPTEADMQSIESLILAAANQTLDEDFRVRIAKTIERVGGVAGTTPIVNLQAFAALASEALYAWSKKDTQLVIHIDEAHARIEHYGNTLLGLHTEGLSRGPVAIPCVVLFTGLPYTANRIDAVEGLSRMSEEAPVSMGEMSHDEGVESTLNMLDTIGAIGDHEKAAHHIATLSFGWPRHLNRAQKALRDELIREEVDGDLACADFSNIKQKSDESRARYYETRLNDPLLARDRQLSIHMLDSIRDADSIRTMRELASVCKRVIERDGMTGDFPLDPRQGWDFAETFIEKGIVVETDRGFDIAIASMGDWAQQLCQQKDS